ncbi:MAG TPA: LLM class flavin-dependent oxidoreductase [Acidimicrobiales bacterium]
MRFGLSIPNMGEPGALVALAAEAEQAGWDGVFLWDHLHFIKGAGVHTQDPWVLLGAIAQCTERVRLGTLVTPVARRRPWKLAKEVLTLDWLSGGRAVLGVGLGEPGKDEFADFGDPGDARLRAELLDEGLDIVAKVWTGEAFIHDGKHYKVDAELPGRPAQQPRPPIWVAGQWPNKAPFRRAARWDGVVPIDVVTSGPITPDRLAECLAFMGDLPPDYDVVATAMEDVQPAEYADAGATWLVESCWPVGDWLPDLRARVLAGPSR